MPPQAQTKKRMGKNNRSLRRLLIYPKFQLLLIGINLSVITFTMIVFWVSTQNALQDLAPAAGLSGIEVEYYKKYLEYQSSQFHKALFLSLLLGVVFSGGLTLLVSHRISGPLVRMRNFFRSLSTFEGETNPLPTLEFRDGDYLSDFPPLVNEAIAHVASHNSGPKKPEKRGP